MKKGKKIILFICALRKDDSKMDKAREILEINNQQQLLNYKKINKEEVKEEILKVDFKQLNSLYKEAVKEEHLQEKKIDPIDSIDKEKLSQEEKEKYQKAGQNIIKNNQYAVVTMAGGQRNKAWS